MNEWGLIIGFCCTKESRVVGLGLEAKRVHCQANPNQQRRRRSEYTLGGCNQSAQGN